jgi:hypothetical protein
VGSLRALGRNYNQIHVFRSFVIASRVHLLSALVTLAVDRLVDGDDHGALGPGQPDAVRGEAVGQGDLPLAVGGLAATVTLLKVEKVEKVILTASDRHPFCLRHLQTTLSTRIYPRLSYF